MYIYRERDVYDIDTYIFKVTIYSQIRLNMFAAEACDVEVRDTDCGGEWGCA